jgi:hypothetical protein
MGPQSARRGLLALCQALVTDDRCFDPVAIDPLDVEEVIDAGFGPALAYVTRDADPSADATGRLQAADLTARVITADMLDVLDATVAAGEAIGCSPVILKGCATALQYYPEPHLRTIGDVDLLVQPGRYEAFAHELRALGFTQRMQSPAGGVDYQRHHHSMPFWHAQRRIWIEVHTRLFPRWSPLATESRFALDAIGSQLSSTRMGLRLGQVMRPELQLVYTSARWAESLNRGRGAFAILDAALLVQHGSTTLDWDRICGLVDRSWGATALALLLGYLHRYDLARIPGDVLRRLPRTGRAERARTGVLHKITTAYVFERRRPGRLLTARTLRTAWSTLVRPRSAWANLFAVPFVIAFPPGGRKWVRTAINSVAPRK